MRPIVAVATGVAVVVVVVAGVDVVVDVVVVDVVVVDDVVVVETGTVVVVLGALVEVVVEVVVGDGSVGVVGAQATTAAIIASNSARFFIEHPSTNLGANWLFGFHRGVMVASRSQLGLPA